MRPGSFLLASPALQDTNFAGTVILLVEASDEGALGFVVNRPTGEVWPAAGSTAGQLFWGGPVERERIWCLSRWGQEGDNPILPGLWWADPREVPKGEKVKFLLGYAGWSAGQLEAEWKEGSWLLVEASVDEVFDEVPGTLWPRLAQAADERLGWLAPFTSDPRLN